MPANSREARTLQAQYDMLTVRFASNPNTFVGIDMLMHYKEGKRTDRLVPDLLVAFRVPKRERSSYDVRKEGKAPDFVLEVASPSTFENDLGHKKDTYERLGVREYCVFDPAGGMHRPRLQLFRLNAGVYKRVSFRGDPDGPMAVTSETLGLELRIDGDELRLWDQEDQAFLLEHREERLLRLAERDEHAKERAMRLAAEQIAAQTQRQLGELQHQLEMAQRQVDNADQRAEKAEQLAESESQARRRAEAELAKGHDQPRRHS